MVESRKCKRCFVVKSISEYYWVDKSKTENKRGECMSCTKKSALAISKTKDGLVMVLYSHQKGSSRKRHHSLPEYNLSELKEWAFSQPVFHKLYDDWAQSGFDKMKAPSIDRKDDYKGYSFDNIQLMTWNENKNKGHSDRRNGVNNKKNKSVLQYSGQGCFIKEFHSHREASRATDTPRASISKCCRGLTGSAGGFIWKYAGE